MSAEERQPLLSHQEPESESTVINTTLQQRDETETETQNTASTTKQQQKPTKKITTPTLAVSPKEGNEDGATGDGEQEQTDTKKDKDGDDDDSDDYESSRIKKPEFKLSPEERAKIRFTWMIVTICCYSAIFITWLVVLVTDSVKLSFRTQVPTSPIPSPRISNDSSNITFAPIEFITAYDIRHAVGDLFVVDCIRTVPMIVFFFIFKGRPESLHPYMYHFGMVMWFFVTAKAWTYASWVTSLNAIPLWVSLFTSTVSLIAYGKIYDCDIPPNFVLSYTGLRKVMGPYILPSNPYARFITICLWIVVALSRASTLVSPIILGEAVRDLQLRDLHYAAIKLIIFGVLQLAPTLLESLQDAVSSYVYIASYREVAELAFSHCLNLDMQWHVTKKLGNVMRSIDRGLNSADRLMSWILLWAVPAIGSGVLSFIVFLAHFKLPILAGVAWLSLCLYIWATVVITKFRRSYNEKQNVHDNDANATSTDAFQNIETVKSFTNEEFEIKNYVESIKKQQTFNYKAQLFTGFVNISQSTIIQLCTVGCLILTGIDAVHSTSEASPVQIATFIAISQYMNNLFSPLSFIGSLYSMTISALTDVQNLAELLDEKPDMVDAEDAVDFREMFPLVSGVPKKDQEGITIEFDNVYFNYPLQDPSKGLKGVSFKVSAGETLALVGSTGAGKSSITRLLFGFYKPVSGSIKFNGVDSNRFTMKSLRREIGLVAQASVLFNQTLRYNIKYGKLEATDAEVDAAVEAAQLKDSLQRFSKGLDTLVGERGTKLSGGEQQRTNIARCLLKDPKILVLDEASSAVDSITERRLQDALDLLANGNRTSFVIAHRLSTIQNATQILVMENGEIVERGKHQQLLDVRGKYHEMWNAQKKAAEEEAQRQASVKTFEGDDNSNDNDNDEKEKEYEN